MLILKTLKGVAKVEWLARKDYITNSYHITTSLIEHKEVLTCMTTQRLNFLRLLEGLPPMSKGQPLSFSCECLIDKYLDNWNSGVYDHLLPEVVCLFEQAGRSDDAKVVEDHYLSIVNKKEDNNDNK